MKAALLLICFVLFSCLTFASKGIPNLKNDSASIKLTEYRTIEQNKEINRLESTIDEMKKQSFQKEKDAYQLNNDRIGNYLTFTGVIATIFGLIIALGGIFIAFESIKSQRTKDEAIRTLEGAKKYVEDKKEAFNKIVDDKSNEISLEYKKIVTLFKEQLINDIDKETQNVKEMASKKTREIEQFNVAQKSNKAVEDLQRRIEFFENIGIPDDPLILLSKAKLLSEKNKHAEAIELLKKAESIAPDNSSVFWQFGWAYSSLSNSKEAINNYSKCIALDTNNHSAYNNRGVEYGKVEKHYEALKEFDKAIELLPTEKLYYRNKAQTFVKLKSPEDVLNTYKQVLEMDKKDPESYNNIISFLSDQGREIETLDYYDKAINNIEEKKYEYNNWKAHALSRLGREKEAVKIFENLIDAKFNQEDCYLSIARIKYEEGKREEAIKIIDKALTLNRQNWQLYISKAEYQIEQDFKKAIETIEEGIAQIKDEAIFYMAARLLSKAGHDDEVKKYFERALEVIDKKITPKTSVDTLNYFEGLIIVERYKDAREFITKHPVDASSAYYRMIMNYIDAVLRSIESPDFNIESAISSIPYEILKEGDMKWSFYDLVASLKRIKYKKVKIVESAIKVIETKY